MTASTTPTRWLTEHDVSDLTQIPVDTLRYWRRPGKVVLPFSKIGRLVRYDEAEINAYISTKKRTA